MGDQSALNSSGDPKKLAENRARRARCACKRLHGSRPVALGRGAGRHRMAALARFGWRPSCARVPAVDTAHRDEQSGRRRTATTRRATGGDRPVRRGPPLVPFHRRQRYPFPISRSCGAPPLMIRGLNRVCRSGIRCCCCSGLRCDRLAFVDTIFLAATPSRDDILLPLLRIVYSVYKLKRIHFIKGAGARRGENIGSSRFPTWLSLPPSPFGSRRVATVTGQARPPQTYPVLAHPKTRRTRHLELSPFVNHATALFVIVQTERRLSPTNEPYRIELPFRTASVVSDKQSRRKKLHLCSVPGLAMSSRGFHLYVVKKPGRVRPISRQKHGISCHMPC